MTTEFVTIRQTNLTNANGNDMGKVASGTHYVVDGIITKVINGVNRLLVLGNRYIPYNDVTQVTVNPPPPPPPPDDPPPPVPTGTWQQTRYSYDGGVTWGAWEFWNKENV